MMEQWNDGKYEQVHLTLLVSAMEGRCKFGRRFDVDFWDSFTLELNKRIKAMEQGFHGFILNAVVKYGKHLRVKSIDMKEDHPNYELLKNCFEKCEHCKYIPKFPSESSLRGHAGSSHQSHVIEPRMTHVSQASSSSSSRVPVTSSGMNNIDDRLAALRENRHLSNGQYWAGLEYLSSNESSARLWLGLSQECQIDTLRSKFPDI